MTEEERERHDRFMRLYVENEESLRGFVRSLVPSREAAREVMQEVAAVLWRKFDALASPEDFRRWSFGIARFEALAAARDFARDRHVFSDDLLKILADEAREALERCLQKLPEAQRAIVSAAYERGARIDDLAARLGRTAMSLYKLLHRVRLALIECTQRELAREGQS
jgi:RNA polymerase sigma-70 factor, ECF subfamily